MNVLIITQYFWPENFKINEIVKDLNEKNNNITILTGYPNYPSGYIYEDFKKNKNNYSKYYNSEIIRVPIMQRGSNKFSLILNYITFFLSAIFFGYFKLKKKKIDIIFVFEPSPITVCFPGIFYKKVFKAPLIMWVLDLWPENLVALKVIKSKFIINCINFFVKYIYNSCDKILGQSESFVKVIKSKVTIKSKVEFFPSWAEDIFFNRKLFHIKKLENFKNNFVILFTGNIGEAQDFQSILACSKILKNYKEIKFLIVGDGRKKEWLIENIKSMGLEESVFVLGQFDIKYMPTFHYFSSVLLISLANSKIFSSTIPAKLQTYLISGKPIVGMINGEASKIIKESNCGLVCEAGNYQQLSNNILKIYNSDLNTKSIYGQNGKNYYVNNFDKKFLTNKLEKIFKNQINKNYENSFNG